MFLAPEQAISWLKQIQDKMDVAEINFSKTTEKEEEKLSLKDIDNKDFADDSNIEAAVAVERNAEETEKDKETLEENKDENSVKKEEESFEEAKEDEKEDEDEAEEEDEEKEEEMSALKAEFETLKASFSVLEQEVVELRKFKADVIVSERKQKVAFTVEEVKDIVPSNILLEWQEKAPSYEDIDVWVMAVKSDAFTFAKATKTADGVNRFGLPFSPEKKNKSTSLWDD